MNRATSQKTIYAALFLLAIVGTASADDPTPVTTCGTVITVAGKYRLTNDLVGCSPFGIQVQTNNVTLLLNGHTISGNGSATAAGILTPSGTTNVSILGPGVITSFFSGINWGSSSSVVANVTATQTDLGFLLTDGTTNNVFKWNTAQDNGAGFSIAGSGNVLKGNDSSGNGVGFVISGTGNEIRGNSANANTYDGIQVSAGSISNNIRGNTALGNNTIGGTSYDLEDDNANCDSNVWQGNEFATSNQACIQ